MQLDEIPSWSATASESIGLLYRELQPIEVYVEDSNSEAFYLELLNRMMVDEQKIKKIIPLHGRDHVLKNCSEYDGGSPALFLIDGDLDLLLAEREQGYTNLFQLSAYCIENYLFCANAARELIVQGSGVIKREDALPEHEWTSFFDPVYLELKNLFVVFAAARKAKPDLKTVAHGLGAIVSQHSKTTGPVVDLDKIQILIENISSQCINEVGQQRWDQLIQEVNEFSETLDFTDVVSGKDFLIPLMTFLIRSKVTGSMTTASLMFKLAKYCSLDRLEDLKKALHLILSGSTFVSQ
ncbi:DUF4435 domain-containing protein [Pseudomonas moraviensis]|uniref:DUF4435 domain-containing protein n=1 Tax=Pseudomonas moraviensis TaxID=321662 RepID=UPI00087B3F82|nr:DUF4435 domain-containing protein [Pseudomonas moraviensis]SDU17735.1 Protein of unknown function [Pseudomonas moraviensis]